MKAVRYLFPDFFKKLDADKTFETAVNYRRSGNLQEALTLCEKLVNDYPHHVYYRRELAILQRSLGVNICLPDITPKSVR